MFAAELDPKGNTSLFIECHVQDYDSQVALFQTVWRKWGRLDGLIANAGIVYVECEQHWVVGFQTAGVANL